MGCTDVKFLITPEGVTPTRENPTHVCPGDDEGRGSIVFYNQATMYMSSETGYSTLKEARAAGMSGVADFPASAQEAFLKYGIPLQP